MSRLTFVLLKPFVVHAGEARHVAQSGSLLTFGADLNGADALAAELVHSKAAIPADEETRDAVTRAGVTFAPGVVELKGDADRLAAQLSVQSLLQRAAAPQPKVKESRFIFDEKGEVMGATTVERPGGSP